MFFQREVNLKNVNHKKYKHKGKLHKNTLNKQKIYYKAKIKKSSLSTLIILKLIKFFFHNKLNFYLFEILHHFKIFF